MAVTTVTVTVAVTVTLAVTVTVNTVADTKTIRTAGSCVQFCSNLLRAFSCSALVPAYQS
jgi:hypothetical protein